MRHIGSSRTGDQFYLLGTGENGAHTVIDFVQTVALGPDEAQYRVGDVWLTGTASPLMDNPCGELHRSGAERRWRTGNRLYLSDRAGGRLHSEDQSFAGFRELGGVRRERRDWRDRRRRPVPQRLAAAGSRTGVLRSDHSARPCRQASSPNWSRSHAARPRSQAGSSLSAAIVACGHRSTTAPPTAGPIPSRGNDALDLGPQQGSFATVLRRAGGGWQLFLPGARPKSGRGASWSPSSGSPSTPCRQRTQVQ